MVQLSYGIFDADNHYYEPRDAFTRFIEPKHRDKAVRVVKDAQGERIMIGEKPFTFLADMELNFDTTLRPGSLRDFLRTLTHENPDESAVQEPVQPAYVNREARLKLMDEQRIESAFLFPTLGVCVEHFMKDDVEQMYANLRAFNRWIDEEWGFAYKGRIYAPPLLSLLDVNEAVKDLEWALGRGTPMIILRTGPAYKHHLADPHFDPFWSRVNEAKIAVGFHVGEAGYNEMMSVWFGEEANPSSHSQSAFQWTNCYGDRPIMDTVSGLVFGNLFGRFPNIRVCSIEHGSLWVPYITKAMDKMKGMGRNGPWPGGRPKGKPSEIFKEHFWINPYHEEDIEPLLAVVGPERVLFGSDYPHPECLVPPAEYAEELKDRPEKMRRDILRDNARRLVGLPV
ncbi:MAG: amidohydrolase [Candidatus Methylomirabilis sp.]|nr:amidohydrolase [Deltaproteobacteria bacterium]